MHSDVLIVGAGSAGSVLAERLSADSSCRVTVLEAGAADVGAWIDDGLILPIGAGSPAVRRYRSRLTLAADADFPLVRGAGVGGSGAVNGGYFCRGLPSDFDHLGLPGWAWSDVLADFRAIESDRDFDGPLHGADGPIPVCRQSEFDGPSAEFISRADAVGLAYVADLNGAQAAEAGVGPVPLNIRDGVRVGPGAAYLRPALSRANLTLHAGVRAARVELSGGRAVAVQAIGPDGATTRYGADRIVLCAGAIESALLLMRSGVGDAELLRAAGIAVRAALPVGAAFSDHPEWLLPVDWPAAPRRPVLEVVAHTGAGIELRPYTCGFDAMVGAPADSDPVHSDPVHIGVALMRTRSRGRLTLGGADPLAPPRIEHRYDEEPADVAALREGAEMIREMTSGAVRPDMARWSTSQHLCGTAPMGADADGRAVLDPQCRVRGVDGLWVVDGSALPTVPSRGPHASIVMLAHRAARFIRG